MATATLNAAQAALLALIAKTGADGCIVYGRPQAASAQALLDRGLVEIAPMPGDPVRRFYVAVAQMGGIEMRPVYRLSPSGFRLFNG